MVASRSVVANRLETPDETGDNSRVCTFRFLEAAHYWAPGVNSIRRSHAPPDRLRSCIVRWAITGGLAARECRWGEVLLIGGALASRLELGSFG